MNLEGSVALVTGANRGLGAVFAGALLDRGAAEVYAAARESGPLTEIYPALTAPRERVTSGDLFVLR